MKNKLLQGILISLYLLIGFLSIHTINNVYFYIISFVIGFLFLLKKQMRLAITFIVIPMILMPLWLLFNNIYYNNFQHYTLLSDVCATFAISFLFNIINAEKINKPKINIIALILALFPFSFCFYYAYNELIYWLSIILIIISASNLINMTFEKINTKKIFISLLLLYLSVAFYYVFDIQYTPPTNKMAILKSEWCDVSMKPPKDSYQLNYYYAYSDFLDILKSLGSVNIIDNKDISKNKLNYNVLIIITPTTVIDTVQTENIKAFVKKGGRLIVIADHTNVYGHIDNMQGLLNSFNFKINDDALFHVSNYYEKSIININNPFFNQLITKTASSIIPPINAKVWAITTRVVSEKADYNKKNFFGDFLFSPDDTVGNFPIGTSLKYGKGYFLIWTDSTLFSNFAITQKNNIQLVDYIIKNRIITYKNHNLSHNILNVYSNINDTFWEAPPNHPPDVIHYSTLIANFTRNNLFPKYINHIEQNTLAFISYDYFIKHLKALKDNKNKVVIIDDIPKVNFLGYKKYDFSNYQEIKNEKDSSNNFYYSPDGINISSEFEGIKVIAAKNVLSDNEMGTWWNTMPISPYKQYMLDSFFNWVSNNKKIRIYNYPKLTCKNETYQVKYENKNEEYWDKICYSIPINKKSFNFIYLGLRKWSFKVDNKDYFGSAELSDDYLNNLDYKWTAKRISKSQIKPKTEHNGGGCMLQKFSIGTTYPAP